MSESVKVNYSARHTRLRFQLLFAGLVFYVAATEGDVKLNLPGIVISDGSPEPQKIILGLGVFFLFTFIGFIVQHNVERRSSPPVAISALSTLELFQDKILNDGAAIKAQYRKLDNFSENISNDDIPEERNFPVYITDDADIQFYRHSEKWVDFIKSRKSEFDKYDVEFRNCFPGSFSKWEMLETRISTVLSGFDRAARKYDTHVISDSEVLELKVWEIINLRSELKRLSLEIESLETIFKSLKFSLRRLAVVEYVHYALLSFWFPLLTATFLFLLGLKTL